MRFFLLHAFSCFHDFLFPALMAFLPFPQEALRFRRGRIFAGVVLFSAAQAVLFPLMLLALYSAGVSDRWVIYATANLAVNTPITIFCYEDEHMQLPEECILVDISAGGCCISSEQPYVEGDVLRLRIKLGDYVPMNLLGEVIRVTERGPRDYSYGILFAQLEKGEQDALTRTLFNLQTGDRQEHSRVNGHW